jgi:tRNA uridine 5-carboxymethylaminomethyl modification enzyme
MKTYDIIVIGAGHAGCEAALAAARLRCSTLLLATNLDTVAFLACNPSIGGTAKGQIVREIDALGGQMALCADSSLLQMRMLNLGKGPAVYSPRAQVDKHSYHQNMKATVENTDNLTLRQGEAVAITKTDDGYIVDTAVGLEYSAKTVVVSCGVYLNSRIITGKLSEDCGPNGFKNAKRLTDSLVALGFDVRRFKTGTPARVKFASIDRSKATEQVGDDTTHGFSYLTDSIDAAKRSCFLTYTTAATKEIILANRDKAPIYNGDIHGVGPRYCPSIEDKVVRFAGKERHQIFLEPEGEHTAEFYVQGASSSMPADIQEAIYHTIDGLENVEIMRDAYAIEYDCIDATQLSRTLESKQHAGLFFAGQINGTSGYEEAACQGLVAGINAARLVKNEPPFVLTRLDSYIGVLIDDITNKENFEPYRMMTSRAEHRLILRQDNADLRLTEMGRAVGLVDDGRYEKYCEKVRQLAAAEREIKEILPPRVFAQMFNELGENVPQHGLSIKNIIKRTNIGTKEVKKWLNRLTEYDDAVLEQLDIGAKYEGYITKQQALIDNAARLESKALPKDIDYGKIAGLRIEAQQKLGKFRPQNLGQAGRILGVSPADVQVLIVYLAQRRI